MFRRPAAGFFRHVSHIVGSDVPAPTTTALLDQAVSSILEPLKLTSTHHTLILSPTPLLATLHSTHIFTNDLTPPTPIELLLRLHTSSTSPHSLTATFYQTSDNSLLDKVCGRIIPRVEAEEEYDDAISEGARGVMVQQIQEVESDSLIQVSVGNVESGVRVEIELVSSIQMDVEIYEDEEEDEEEVEEVGEEEKVPLLSFSHRIGAIRETLLATDHVEKNVSLEVKIPRSRSGTVSSSQTWELVDCDCQTHPFIWGGSGEPEGEGEVEYVVYRSREETRILPTQDCVVQLKIRNFPLVSYVAAKLETPEQRNWLNPREPYDAALFASVIPNFGEAGEAGEVIGYEFDLVVDCSGSMSQESRMEAAREALLIFLRSLDMTKNIRFNILRFGTRFECLFDRPVRLNDDDYLTHANQYVEGLKPNMGGTNMLTSLNWILGIGTVRPTRIRVDVDPASQPSDENITFRRQIFLFTDGEDSNSYTITELAKKQHAKDGTRIFSFGIGRSINESFLRNCARFSGAEACFVSHMGNMKAKILRQLMLAQRTAIYNCSLELVSDSIVKADRIKDEKDRSKKVTVFNGLAHQSAYWVRLKPGASLEDLRLDVCYEYKKKLFSHHAILPILSPEVEVDNPSKTSNLVRTIVARGAAKLIGDRYKKRLTSIGVAFGILTKETSLSLVSEDGLGGAVTSSMKTVRMHMPNPSARWRTRRMLLGMPHGGGRGSGWVSVGVPGTNQEFAGPHGGDWTKTPGRRGGSRGGWGGGRGSGRGGMGGRRGGRRRRSGRGGGPPPKPGRPMPPRRQGPGDIVTRSSSLVSGGGGGAGIGVSESSPPPVDPTPSSVATPANLSALLLKADMKGMFPFDEPTCRLVAISSPNVKTKMPEYLSSAIPEQFDLKKAQSLWFTAILVAVFTTYYASLRTEWRLIARKSRRTLKKSLKDAGVQGLILKDAQLFLMTLDSE